MFFLSSMLCSFMFFNHILSAGWHLQVNGEIYNHEELKAKLTSHKFQTGSDCEVIAHLVSNNSYFSMFSFFWNPTV
jgi:asparagine synthetase B (glutamine-hydrolysing)